MGRLFIITGYGITILEPSLKAQRSPPSLLAQSPSVASMLMVRSRAAGLGHHPDGRIVNGGLSGPIGSGVQCSYIGIYMDLGGQMQITKTGTFSVIEQVTRRVYFTDSVAQRPDSAD